MTFRETIYATYLLSVPWSVSMRTKSLALTTLVAVLATGIPLSSPAWADQPTPAASQQAPDVFFTGGDAVHYSSTPPATISAHGWWIDKNSGGAKAKVTVELQIQKSDGGWRTVATGSKNIKQGGGSARRANARKTCVGAKKTKWRSRVDVDIIGSFDSPDKLITPAKTFNCGVG
ncbi:hypothetical protein [Streptomyces sp. NPDC048442]|uniref:hypothetical protein n=1 Tax=Streptomyces sp. NPDC048442 TaxID=3154823 RepID=UPI00341D6754